MRTQIEKKLKQIMEDRFKIDFARMKEADYDITLFDEPFGFIASEMLYLFFDVEKAFGITIPEQDIEENHFSSFNSIVDIIERQLKAS